MTVTRISRHKARKNADSLACPHTYFEACMCREIIKSEEMKPEIGVGACYHVQTYGKEGARKAQEREALER